MSPRRLELFVRGRLDNEVVVHSSWLASMLVGGSIALDCKCSSACK